MGEDLPDGTKKITLAFTGGFVGLEELAVRLGSIVPYDLLGNVMLMDDFENAYTEWVETTVGAGSSVSRVETTSWSKTYCIKLVAGTGGSGLAAISRYLSYPQAVKVGVFCMAKWDNTLEEFIIPLEIYTGSYFCQVELKYDFLNTRLQIYDSTDAYVTIDDDLTLGGDVAVWYPVMFTFDLENDVFDKVYIGYKEYDVSTYSLAKSADTSAPVMLITLEAYENGGGGFTMHVDDVVVVRNMP